MADFNVTVYSQPFGVAGIAGAAGANADGTISINGKTGALQGVCSIGGLTGTVGVSAGININIATVGNTLTVATVSTVARTDTAQTFNALQQFNGFSATDIYVSQSLDTPPGITSPGTAGNILFSYEAGILYMYYCVQSGVWRRFTGSTY